MRLVFSQAEEQQAYRIWELGVLLVRGKGLAYSAPDISKIDRLVFQLEPTLMGERSRSAWLNWFSELFAQIPILYAFGCLETEYYAKHSIDYRLPDGMWQTDLRGCRPGDFKTCLPGVYWINYYGSEIGGEFREKLANSSDLEVTDLGQDRFWARLEEPLVPLDLSARLANERRVAVELGEKHFFDREAPSSRREQVPRLRVLLESLLRRD